MTCNRFAFLLTLASLSTLPAAAQVTPIPLRTSFVGEMAPRAVFNPNAGEYMVVYLHQRLLVPLAEEGYTYGFRLDRNGNKVFGSSFSLSSLTKAPAAVGYSPTSDRYLVASHAWQDESIILQSFDGNGVKLGGERIGMLGSLDDASKFDASRWEGVSPIQLTYNELADEFLLTAQLRNRDGSATIYAQRLSPEGHVLAPRTTASPTTTIGGRFEKHSVAFSPNPTPEHPGGWYVLVAGDQPGILDADGVYRGWAGMQWRYEGLFDRGYDVAIGANQTFQFVWENRYQQTSVPGCFGNGPFTGIFGGELDGTSPLTTPGQTVGDLLPDSAICSLSPSHNRFPKVAYNEAAGAFYAVWRETGTNDTCNAPNERGMHIRMTELTSDHCSTNDLVVSQSFAGLPSFPHNDPAPCQPFIVSADDGSMLVLWDQPGTTFGDEPTPDLYAAVVSVVPTTCEGDIDGDGHIALSDLAALLGAYGCVWDCEADLNHDGVVNLNDLAILLSVFGEACP